MRVLVKLFGDNTVQQKALSGVALVLSRTGITPKTTSVRPRDVTGGMTPRLLPQQQPKPCPLERIQAQQQQGQM